MPPKTWNKTGMASSRPSATGNPIGAAHGSSTTTATKQNSTAVRNFITKAITDNNLLGLPDEEIKNMVGILISVKTTKEVFEWCGTLMLGDTVAADIIKRREDNGLPFGATAEAKKKEDDTASLATTTTSSSSGGKKSRGRNKSKPLSAVPANGLVPGTFFECGCFGTTHNYRSTCLNCGRIFCEQESDEYCYYCGLDPKQCVAYELKKQHGLINEAAEQKNKKNYEKALEKRDTLLSFAKERAKRTVVIDDQAGTHANSAWLTKQERDEALEAERKKVTEMHKTTGAYTVHLDIVGQAVSLGCEGVKGLAIKNEAEDEAPAGTAELNQENVLTSIPASAAAMDEDNSTDDEGEDRVMPMPTVLQKIWYSPDGSKVSNSKVEKLPDKPKQALHRSIATSCRVQNDYFEEDDQAWHEEVQDNQPLTSSSAVNGDDVSYLTFTVHDVPDAPEDATQDVFQPIVEHVVGSQQVPRGIPNTTPPDDGMCLSMHQPWASLLVAGIKRHEGRSWPSDFRGKLWIHAAAAKPSGIQDLENYYSKFPWNEGKKFPTHYPTSCLLGYVIVKDCLDTEQYHAAFPAEEREENSDFKFICENPKAILFPLQMDGQHKIYKLERKIWKAARKQIGEK